jgi:hypothetical protein
MQYHQTILDSHFAKKLSHFFFFPVFLTSLFAFSSLALPIKTVLSYASSKKVLVIREIQGTTIQFKRSSGESISRVQFEHVLSPNGIFHPIA